MRHFSRRWLEIACVVTPVCLGMAIGCSQTALQAAGPARTAPAPKFDTSVIEAFVPDIRKTVGPGTPGPSAPVGAPSTGGPSAPGAPAAPGGGGKWAAVISGENIEGEVRFQQKILEDTVKTLNGFKSGGNVKARDSLLMLATLFAVIGKYDGEVKWKKDWEGMQQGMMQAGNNCKTSSDAAYKEAKLRTDQLKEVLNGQGGDLPKLDPETNWGTNITINPLMKRLEMAEKEHLVEFGGDVSKHKEKAIREGEVLALIGQFIVDPSFELTENADYKGWALALNKAGKDLAEATKSGDQAKAAAAISAIKQTCVDCHGAYR